MLRPQPHERVVKAASPPRCGDALFGRRRSCCWLCPSLRAPLEPRPRPASVVPARVRRPPEHASVGIIDRNATAASHRPSTRCAAVAATVLGTRILRAVVIGVSQIPGLARNDQPAAAGARHVTRRNPRLPHAPQTLMRRAVTPLNRLLRRQIALNSDSGREMTTAAGVAVVRQLAHPPVVSGSRSSSPRNRAVLDTAESPTAAESTPLLPRTGVCGSTAVVVEVNAKPAELLLDQ